MSWFQQGADTSQMPPWMSKGVPAFSTALSTAGSLIGGNTQAAALRYNARTYASEGTIAANQAQEQEMQTRRMGAKAIGQETAAAGQAGAGYGGSTGRAIAQSMLNTQLDALNTRYKGQMQKWSFTQQSQNLDAEAGTARANGLIRAGAQLLKGYSGNYTGMTPVMSGGF